MPRKPEPSFSLKKIIWDIAASSTTNNFAAIYREVDHRLHVLRREGKLFEDMPEERKVRDIIRLDIQRLQREVVVAKLPRHVWPLRNDYEAICQLAEESIEAERRAPIKEQIEQKPYEETEHKRKMRELAGSLQGEISLPPIFDCFIVELKPRQFYPARRNFSINMGANEEIRIELSIDKGGDIDQIALKSHLETGGFSEVLEEIANWKEEVQQYLKQCHGLLKIVMSEIENGKRKIPLEDKKLKPGFIIDFPKTICADAVQTARDHPLGFEYKTGPEAHPTYENMWLLRCGAYIIYRARSKKTLVRYQAMHKKLKNKYASEPIVVDIVEQQAKINQIQSHINQRLRVFTEKEHLPGYCSEFCS